MKPEDLMVGDWVNFLIDIEGGDTEHDPKNEIYQPMQIVSLTAWGGNDGEVESAESVINGIDQVKPIPITAEILEKNFSQHSRYVYDHCDDYFDLYITEFSDGLWCVTFDEIEMSGLPTWKMYVSNVHELQHALRLCNIEKEIEL